MPQRRIARAGIARTFQHVKIRPQHDAAGQRPPRRPSAHDSRASCPGHCGSTRPKKPGRATKRMRQLERVGLGDRPFELAGNLPLGNQRVLEIARALAADPVLLLLDEPAAGLRRQEKLALAELLRSLRSEHLTILLVEHDMEFVMGLVDRIVVMNFGSKLCEGCRRDDPPAIPRVQDAYLGGASVMAPALAIRRPARGLWQGRGGARRLAVHRAAARSSRSSAPTARARPRCSAPRWGFCPRAARCSSTAWICAALDVEARVERGFCLVPERASCSAT